MCISIYALVACLHCSSCLHAQPLQVSQPLSKCRAIEPANQQPVVLCRQLMRLMSWFAPQIPARNLTHHASVEDAVPTPQCSQATAASQRSSHEMMKSTPESATESALIEAASFTMITAPSQRQQHNQQHPSGSRVQRHDADALITHRTLQHAGAQDAAPKSSKSSNMGLAGRTPKSNVNAHAHAPRLASPAQQITNPEPSWAAHMALMLYRLQPHNQSGKHDSGSNTASSAASQTAAHYGAHLEDQLGQLQGLPMHHDPRPVNRSQASQSGPGNMTKDESWRQRPRGSGFAEEIWNIRKQLDESRQAAADRQRDSMYTSHDSQVATRPISTRNGASAVKEGRKGGSPSKGSPNNGHLDEQLRAAQRVWSNNAPSLQACTSG